MSLIKDDIEEGKVFKLLNVLQQLCVACYQYIILGDRVQDLGLLLGITLIDHRLEVREELLYLHVPIIGDGCGTDYEIDLLVLGLHQRAILDFLQTTCLLGQTILGLVGLGL